METGPRMLYMIGKIFLYGISFDIVYNELVHKNMNKSDLFFLQSSETNMNLLKPEMEVRETALCHRTHILSVK